jgi:hypothetical protein
MIRFIASSGSLRTTADAPKIANSGAASHASTPSM